mmetsp:Transcript_47776/g.121907  ORF Transcript_47776/g.121907 Transcript_47776/m.121907 type:complete len:88 (-) Transcript_47776:357-620(-)
MACAAATAALNCGADVGGGAAEKPGATGPGAILDASCCAAMAGAAAMAAGTGGGGTARVGARRGGATVATGASGRTAPVLDATKEDL